MLRKRSYLGEAVSKFESAIQKKYGEMKRYSIAKYLSPLQGHLKGKSVFVVNDGGKKVIIARTTASPKDAKTIADKIHYAMAVKGTAVPGAIVRVVYTDGKYAERVV
jgi:hypothetical protein